MKLIYLIYKKNNNLKIIKILTVSKYKLKKEKKNSIKKKKKTNHN